MHTPQQRLNSHIHSITNKLILRHTNQPSRLTPLITHPTRQPHQHRHISQLTLNNLTTYSQLTQRTINRRSQIVITNLSRR